MKLSIQDLKPPRPWRSAVGCDAQQFDALAGIVTQAYATLHGLQLIDSMVMNPIGTQIKNETDWLFFTLFSGKSGLTYDVLGLVCGRDAATAKRRQDEGLAASREALRGADWLPERDVQLPTQLQRYFSKRRAILLDATEFATQRPPEKTAQKAQHSGKKRHTLKALVASTAQRKISCVSQLVPGSMHGFTLLSSQPKVIVYSLPTRARTWATRCCKVRSSA